MSVSYDTFVGGFLSKITEYDFATLLDADRTEIVDGYLKRAVVAFKKNCMYDLSSAANDEEREFDVEVADKDLDELVEIISEGMVAEWMKPYVYHQEQLQNVISTRDYSVYSPAELLMRVGNAYAQVKKDYTQMIREYSYNHGDLTRLHI